MSQRKLPDTRTVAEGRALLLYWIGGIFFVIGVLMIAIECIAIALDASNILGLMPYAWTILAVGMGMAIIASLHLSFSAPPKEQPQARIKGE